MLHCCVVVLLFWCVGVLLCCCVLAVKCCYCCCVECYCFFIIMIIVGAPSARPFLFARLASTVCTLLLEILKTIRFAQQNVGPTSPIYCCCSRPPPCARDTYKLFLQLFPDLSIFVTL